MYRKWLGWKKVAVCLVGAAMIMQGASIAMASDEYPTEQETTASDENAQESTDTDSEEKNTDEEETKADEEKSSEETDSEEQDTAEDSESEAGSEDVEKDVREYVTANLQKAMEPLADKVALNERINAVLDDCREHFAEKYEDREQEIDELLYKMQKEMTK